jgi:hypothetical protein
MSQLLNMIASPLPRSYCNYYLFFTIFSFILLVLSILFEIVYILKNVKRLNKINIMTHIALIFNFFLAYFLNRLSYSMCIKAL